MSICVGRVVVLFFNMIGFEYDPDGEIDPNFRRLVNRELERGNISYQCLTCTVHFSSPLETQQRSRCLRCCWCQPGSLETQKLKKTSLPLAPHTHTHTPGLDVLDVFQRRLILVGDYFPYHMIVFVPGALEEHRAYCTDECHPGHTSESPATSPIKRLSS